eukprot:358532-Chlamydomonas_euryale.AAC.6
MVGLRPVLYKSCATPRAWALEGRKRSEGRVLAGLCAYTQYGRETATCSAVRPARVYTGRLNFQQSAT